MRLNTFVVATGLGLLVLLPRIARSQSATAGSIGGVVKDSSGAVLPGVTVEAASPALIEKVRTVLSDAQGAYKIIDLRPGTYTVTFTLQGFSTLKREGIELTTGFTAATNAEMKVGALAETVTVTGASPVVDLQNVRTQNVLSRQVLDEVPTNKSVPSFAALTLGATVRSGGSVSAQDVGGNKGENASDFGIHGVGGGDMKLKMDGMNTNSLHSFGGGMVRLLRPNDAVAQEIVLEVGGMTAESETGGVQLNIVPKEGGNRFKTSASFTFATESMAGDNLSDTIRARGLTSAPSIKQLYDVGGGVGGPVRRDRLWFFAAARSWASQEYQPGAFYNKSTNPLFYVADATRPGYQDLWNRDITGRLTWQATQKQKVSFQYSWQDNCICYFGVSATASPESTIDQSLRPTLTQATWLYPATNRLLLEAGFTYGVNDLTSYLVPETVPGAIAIVEQSTGLQYAARGTQGNRIGTGSYTADGGVYTTQTNQRFSMSYVTGSHAFKAGVLILEGWAGENAKVNGALTYTFLNQRPLSLTEWISPSSNYQRLLPNMGIFGQDQWTIKRLTLNLGLRYDMLKAYTPDYHYGGGEFAAAFDYPAIHDVPSWNDLSPRLGGAYDLFGNGKTAVKGYFGRYLVSQGIGLAQSNHPSLLISNNATRTWNDANGNFAPDCDLKSAVANGECGALTNARFGQIVIVNRYADDVLKGFGVRAFDWQGSVSLQHQLRPRTAVNVAYYRTTFGKFSVTDNLAVTPADYSPYCITSPVDGRLPGGGGQQMCGLYDMNPSKFGQVDNLVAQAENYGTQVQTFDGVDIAVNARLGAGALLNGGVSFGRTVTDNCFAVDSPQATRPGFCNVTPPWSAGTQIKLNGLYPLPYGIQASAVFQNLPGAPVSATYTARNAEIAPTLGRNLAAGVNGTASVPLIESQTMFEKRLTQVDLRLAKNVRLGHARLQGMLDIYNLLNADTILGIVTTYGPAWLRPTGILGARLFKIGGQLDF